MVHYNYMAFIERKNYRNIYLRCTQGEIRFTNIHLRCTQGEIRYTNITLNILQGLCTHTKIYKGNIKTNDQVKRSYYIITCYIRCLMTSRINIHL